MLQADPEYGVAQACWKVPRAAVGLIPGGQTFYLLPVFVVQQEGAVKMPVNHTNHLYRNDKT